MLVWAGTRARPDEEARLLAGGGCLSSFGLEDEERLALAGHADVLGTRLQGRRLLSAGLSLLNQSWQSVAMHHDALGRPMLKLPGVSVSFSYTDRACCLLAVHAPGMPCRAGVDWEAPRLDHLPPPRWFSREEQALLERLRSVSPAIAAASALRLWCAREAVLKAHGTGMRQPPDALNIDPRGRGQGFAYIEGQAYAWRRLYLPGAMVCSAVPAGESFLLKNMRVLRLV